MRLKKTVAFALALSLAFSGSAFADGTNGTGASVETQSTYDEQYPLAGMLDQLGLNFATTPQGIDMLYWSSKYQQYAVGFDAADSVLWNKVKETNNLNYWYKTVDYTSMLAIAKLAGVSVNLPYANEEQAEAIANNVREFFKAFPNWKTASDYEKACHIARWIEQAEYGDSGSGIMNGAYKCLVEKKCNCSGYTEAAQFLAQCIGLQVSLGYTESQNHEFPVFNINGVWLSYDASFYGTEQSFQIYDVYAEADYAINKKAVELGLIDYNADKPGNTYKYFKDRGYVVPTSLRDKFDSSLIGTITDKNGTRDTLKLQ